MLAPVALAVFAVVFFAVILSSGSSDEKSEPAKASATKRAASAKAKSPPPKRTPATYTVKIGDNLPRIAEKTGLTVKEIEELNPELDPYGLQSGQKIKLRE